MAFCRHYAAISATRATGHGKDGTKLWRAFAPEQDGPRPTAASPSTPDGSAAATATSRNPCKTNIQHWL